MSSLPIEYKFPLKVITARAQWLKNNCKGIIKKIEEKAIKSKIDKKGIPSIVTWDEWIYSALDCYDLNWRNGLKAGDYIPNNLINKLPCTVGELITLGTWLLTKNIYRFDDNVAQDLTKSKFEGNLPNFLFNISDTCIYVQTDNFDLFFQESKIYGVIFTITELNLQTLLVSTIFLDTGLSRTIVLLINENKSIDDCLTDFINEFYDDKGVLREDEVIEYRSLQKKLINILLWFSLSKPDYEPIFPNNHKKKNEMQTINKFHRLFESKKYKPFFVGKETSEMLKKIKKNISLTLADDTKNYRKPHLRRAHYHLYWYGEKGKYERYEFKWIPITLIGGIKFGTE